jgi:hypothetical protein
VWSGKRVLDGELKRAGLQSPAELVSLLEPWPLMNNEAMLDGGYLA